MILRILEHFFYACHYLTLVALKTNKSQQPKLISTPVFKLTLRPIFPPYKNAHIKFFKENISCVFKYFIKSLFFAALPQSKHRKKIVRKRSFRVCDLSPRRRAERTVCFRNSLEICGGSARLAGRNPHNWLYLPAPFPTITLLL